MIKTQFIVSFAGGVVLACAAFMAGSGPAEKATPTQDVPLLSPDSNAHAVLSQAFYESGYSGQDSADLATRCIRILEGKQVRPAEQRPSREVDALPLHPDSNPHAILADVFRESGWSMADAARHASSAVMAIRGIEPEPWELGALGEECWVYAVQVVQQSEPGATKKLAYINGLCYESELKACRPPARGEEVQSWYRIAHEPGSCQWLAATAEDGAWVPCSVVSGDLIDCDTLD